jgi:hypothetical protein
MLREEMRGRLVPECVNVAVMVRVEELSEALGTHKLVFRKHTFNSVNKARNQSFYEALYPYPYLHRRPKQASRHQVPSNSSVGVSLPFPSAANALIKVDITLPLPAAGPSYAVMMT